MNTRQNIVILLFLLILGLTSPAQENTPRLSNLAQISILTCSPGNEVYSVYGHSAIRIKDNLYNYDSVFNYGIFDFSSPNFLYRFASGQTDYLLGVYRFNSFMEEYKEDKRSVYEQVLNLTQEEKQKIFDYLVWNAKPENRVYRYNFFFDNCASRVRDVVADNIEGGVTFQEQATNKTLRRLIKDYHGKLLWLNFGIDFLVSSPSDRPATLSEEMFLPDYVMKHFATAVKTSRNVPVVKSSHVLYQAPESHFRSGKLTSPFVVFLILFLLVGWFTIKQFRKGTLKSSLDYILYGLNGFGGLLVGWFVLYSEHPAMHPNYNLAWLIPLNLIFVLAWAIKKWRPVLKFYHVVLAAWLIFFICCHAVFPQKFHPVFFLIAGIMLIRSLAHSAIFFKELRSKKERE